MTALHQQIRRTIQRHRLCPSGSRVLVGLSGGSDSVALAVVLRELSEHGGFSVVGLAHLNHRMRATADRDEAFCRRFADVLHLPIHVESIDVEAYAVSQRLSREDAARRLRYEFLRRVATEITADRVAVGHTRDDQAETFLLKLIRGAGLTGLAGIYPQRDEVIRPLLDVSRQELRDFLSGRGYEWVDDETNDDIDNPRNRIRHHVLPELNRVYGSATSAIARAAGLVREDAQWLDETSQRRYEVLVSRGDGRVQIDAAGLLAEPGPIQRRILLMALRCAVPGREIGLDHIEGALLVASGQSGGLDMPGARVELRREKLVLLIDNT
ncbi:MAG TPA: tRNA lysidine(34) synthetase TilS [Vicinamibacterales bacterium]|nr:tRNA lysidine(34) synthetase TilS [Vicinamibacterales bacterium]